MKKHKFSKYTEDFYDIFGRIPLRRRGSGLSRLAARGAPLRSALAAQPPPLHALAHG